MAELSHETVRLLDRLFNLRGLENVIVRGIEEEIKRNNELTDRERENQTQNEVAKVDCEGRLSVFETQKGIFENAFAGLDNETFSALRDIDVNIEIGTMLKTISEKSPEFCDKLSEQIRSYQADIDNNKARIEELRSELVDLEESKKKSMDDRDKLDSLLEQSLSSDEMERESLSTSYVKKILGLFGLFSADEINVLAKLIMFPDDGLYRYSETYEDRVKDGLVNLDDEPEPELEFVPEEVVDPATKEEHTAVQDEHKEDELSVAPTAAEESAKEVYEDIVPVANPSVLDGETSLIDLSSLNRDTEVHGFGEEVPDADEDIVVLSSEPKSETVVPKQTVEETIVLTSDKKESKDGNPFSEMMASDSHTLVDTMQTDDVSDAKEVSETDTKIADFLKSIGLDEADFITFNKILKLEEIYKLFTNVSEKVVRDNYDLLRSLNISREAIYTCVSVDGIMQSYLTDLDLSKKVTYLRAKGISEKVIKELLEDKSNTLRSSYIIFEEKVNAVENSVGKLDDENVGLIKTDIVLFDKNCHELSSFGIELEEQELRNNRGILTASSNVAADLKVLKNYLISLVRKNGKYALSPFWKSQYELLTDVDDLIEANLDGLFEYDPEVLGQSASEVIKRVKYCLERNIPVYEEEDKSVFNDYIVNYSKFAEKFGESLGVSLENREDVNQKLPSIIGNEGYVEILTSILDEYYRTAEDLVDITMDKETEVKFDELKSLLGEKLNATPTGKYTYRVEDVSISKNKFERHLAVILNALANSGQPSYGVEREILLTALLYNLRQDDETLRKVVESGLGFKVNVKTLGGNNL